MAVVRERLICCLGIVVFAALAVLLNIWFFMVGESSYAGRAQYWSTST